MTYVIFCLCCLLMLATYPTNCVAWVLAVACIPVIVQLFLNMEGRSRAFDLFTGGHNQELGEGDSQSPLAQSSSFSAMRATQLPLPSFTQFGGPRTFKKTKVFWCYKPTCERFWPTSSTIDSTS